MGSKMCVRYNTNNSGGSYWLTSDDWQKLRDAGWRLEDWGNAYYENGNSIADESGLPKVKYEADVYNAVGGYKMFNTIQEAISEFEELTGQDVSDEGCNCCGPPHSFTWGRDIITRLPKEELHEQDYNCASGEDLLKYMYDSETANLSKRELLERARREDV